MEFTGSAAVKTAGLVDTLQGPGPFTVFAQTNAAFTKLPMGTVDSLLKPQMKEKLVAVLTYHVVPGRLTVKDLWDASNKGGGKTKFKTVEGEEPARWLGPAALLSFQSDLRNSREAESSRRRRRYVNNATTHKGAAVVDGQDDRTPTTFVRDPHFAAERQRAVCGGERRAIELLTACDSASAFVGIDRGEAGLICCRWCEINGANLTS